MRDSVVLPIKNEISDVTRDSECEICLRAIVAPRPCKRIALDPANLGILRRSCNYCSRCKRIKIQHRI